MSRERQLDFSTLAHPPTIGRLSSLSGHLSESKIVPFPTLLSSIEKDGPHIIKSVIREGISEEAREGTEEFLGIVDLLPAQSPVLKQVWQTLLDSLDIEKTLQTGNPDQTVRAFLIASGLLASTKLTFSERRDKLQKRVMPQSISDMRLLFGIAMPKEQEQDTQMVLINQVNEATNKFKAVCETILSEPMPNKDAILRNLNLLNALAREVDGSTPTFNYYAERVGKKNVKEIDQIIKTGIQQTMKGNKNALELLLQGRLDKSDVFVRSFAFLAIITSDLPKTKALEYFLQHPEVQKPFWKYFFLGGWISPETGNIFLQDQSILSKILATIPEELISPPGNKRNEFLSKLIGTVAILKLQNPNHPNIPYLIDQINQLKTRVRDRSTDTLMKILQDKIPGFLYMNGEDGLVLFRIPQEGQDLDSISLPLYTSRADFAIKKQGESAPTSRLTEEKPITPTPIVKEKPTPLSENWEKQNTTLWGEVMIPNSKDVTSIWDMLNQKFTQSHGDFTKEKAFRTLQQENEKERHGDNREPFLIIPELLPSSISSRMLKDLGIIGIEQRGSQIAIILNLNSEKILLPAPGVKLTDLSPAQLLLQTATLIAKRSFIEQNLTGAERSEIRAQIKAWNTKAKTEHLTQLAFDEDPTGRVNNLRVLTFVNNKPVILSINS